MTMVANKEASLLYGQTEQAYYNYFGYWLNTYDRELRSIIAPNDIITLKSAKAFKKMVDEAIEKNEPIKTTPMEFDTIE